MHARQDQSDEAGFRITPHMVIAAIIALIALVFIFQNTNEGRVVFLMWTFSLPTWIWLLVIFVAGVVVGSLFPWMRRRRR